MLPDEEEDTSYFTLTVDVPTSKPEKEGMFGNFFISDHLKETMLMSKYSLSEGSLTTGWQLLKLQYDVQWPLHIVIKPSFLEK